MRPLIATAVLGIATAAFYLWLTLVGSQVSPMLLLVVYLIGYFAGCALLWRKLLGWRLMARLAVGAANGFVAAMLSGAVSDTWFRGSTPFPRTVELRLKTPGHAGQLYAAFAGCGTARGNRTGRHGPRRVYGTGDGSPARA